MSISQIPSGWTITRSDERIVVQHASGSFYAAAKEGDSGIAESILYMLADSLLSATLSPAHIEDAQSALTSIMEWTAATNVPDERKLCLIRNAARAALSAPAAADGSEPAEVLAARLISERAAVLGHPVPWAQAIEITATITKMPDEEKAALLALDDAPPAAGVPEDLREAVADAVAEALGEALDCTRVWSAWGVGTMSEDDFRQVADDPERVAEIADAAIAAMVSAAPTPPASGQQQADAELLHLIDQHRIELLPEYDAGYTAIAYCAQTEPIAQAVAMTARGALEELAKKLQSAAPRQGGE